MQKNNIDIIYDNFVTEEKLKNGTKYEKIAAIVFKVLSQNDVVIHDMRLKAVGKKAAHQIDITIQKTDITKRILVECKQYNQTIGIGIIRDFYGAISQIKPDEAFVITTKGFTKGARNFAEDEGIKLAILREFNDNDWEDRIRKIHITSKMIFMNVPVITWIAANEEELQKATNLDENNEEDIQSVNTADSYFYDKDENPTADFQSIFQPIFNSLPRDPNKTTAGRHEFNEIKYIKSGNSLIGVRGFDYKFSSSESIIKTEIDEGKKIALLLFKVLDGTFDQIIFDQDIEKWTFDEDGEVIQKQ